MTRSDKPSPGGLLVGWTPGVLKQEMDLYLTGSSGEVEEEEGRGALTLNMSINMSMSPAGAGGDTATTVREKREKNPSEREAKEETSKWRLFFCLFGFCSAFRKSQRAN